MGHTPKELNELIGKACAGDRRSLETLLMHFHDPLLQFAETLCAGQRGSATSAEDLLQETLIEAFRSVRTLDARGPEAFLAWLKTVARTRLINLQKASRAQKRGGGRKQIHAVAGTDATVTSIMGLLAGRDPTPSWIARNREVLQAVGRAVSQLDPARRQMVEWRFGMGLPFEEIAQMSGKTEGAVKMLINRCIKELRENMGKGFGNSGTGA